MRESVLRKDNHPQYTPEEVALVMRLRIFGRMGWFAILGVIIATLVASQVFKISFPTLPVYITCVFMAAYNLVLIFGVRSLDKMAGGLVIPRARMLSNIHIWLDLAALTVLLHFTGGIENPFIFLFALHIVAASIALHYRVVYLLSTAVILMVTLLVGLEYVGLIPHVNLAGFAAPTLYREGGYIISVLVSLATILYATTFMATAVSGELRKRQRQVVELSESIIQERTEQLEQASKEITKLAEEKARFLRFLGIAAHDLKAPLTAIQGFLWVMLGGFSGELNEKQKNMLERSSRRITELLGLISDLLDIPRIEAGQIIQEMKEISLSQIVQTCVDDLSDKAKEKGLGIKVESPPSLLKVNGSSARLQQVVTNLLDNAITYTPAGEVKVRVSEDRGDARVEVMDTGIGIPPEDLPRVFTDFFRGSNVEVKGTGLGLSISKRIIEAHGGKIWCESPCPETNNGSKFIFTLPKLRAAGGV